ncbi:TIR domain-containing protein [Subtercola vilae]|uniref:TIR domain-containing protein n=1 Tax=Subtercola vilae TaxID=2056433 RepID=A0A4T2BKP9_9MICO|nr:TIR domain-containing protein [Subtercola vilae]TIH29826.1 TIR domain-containing protein [Subtercola vilae]
MTSVFYSFYYKRDVNRVQLVRQINALDKQPFLTAQKWEEVERNGSKAVAQWIDDNMKYKSAVIVLVGQETANRPWVKYEIEKAWADRRPLLGVRIHGLSSFGTTDKPGADPFAKANITGNVPIFDPTKTDIWGKIDSQATYKSLSDNLEGWAARGVTR